MSLYKFLDILNETELTSTEAPTSGKSSLAIEDKEQNSSISVSVTEKQPSSNEDNISDDIDNVKLPSL